MTARRLVLATTMNTMTRMKNEDMMRGMPCVCERPEREYTYHCKMRMRDVCMSERESKVCVIMAHVMRSKMTHCLQNKFR